MRNRRVAVSVSRRAATIAQDARAVVVAAERLGRAASPSPYSRVALRGGARQRARDVGVAARCGDDAHLAAGRRRRRRPPRPLRWFRAARWRSRAPAARAGSPRRPAGGRRLRRRRSRERPRGRGGVAHRQRARASTSSQVALGAERPEHRACLLEVALGGRAVARARGQPAERQVAQRGVVALAEQLEDARALREVVVRGCGPLRLLVHRAADAEELAPAAGRRTRVEPASRTTPGAAPPRRSGRRPRALRTRPAPPGWPPPAARPRVSHELLGHGERPRRRRRGGWPA